MTTTTRGLQGPGLAMLHWMGVCFSELLLSLYSVYAGGLERKNIMDGKPDFRQQHQLALF